MIDWSQSKVEDFSIQYHVEENRPSGDRIVFAVGVYGKDEVLVFTKPVTIRSDWYNKCMKLEDGDVQLRKVLRNRVRDDIVQRINAGEVDIAQEIKLLDAGSEQLAN